MKSLTILIVTLATAFALPGKVIKSRNLIVPAGRPEGRVTRGHDASNGQFPYQVGLSVKSRDGKYYWCGGSLLNNEWVLTAAHCTEDLSTVTVLLGSTNLPFAEVAYVVSPNDVIIHKDYNNDTVEHDISLIKIPYTQYSDKIQPVKLPALSQSYSDYNGDAVIASGWGRTSDSPSSSPKKLQWARLNIIPNGVCQKYFVISSTNICTATVSGVNICDGDSGGPLVLESSKIQIGLTSFGDESCIVDLPSVFIRITSYLEWIKQFTGVSY